MQPARFAWCLVALAGCARASAQSTAARAPGWYDPTPLLVSLRAPERSVDALARAAGVAHLEDLPLYDLAVAIDPTAATFTVGEDLWFTNTTGAPLNEIVLRIYSNVLPPSQATRPPPIAFARGACVEAPGCTVALEAPSVVVAHPAAPLAPGGRLRVHVELRGALERIDSSRTNMFAQGLEGLSSLGSSDASGDYGILSVGDGIASLANFYAVVASRRDGRWQRAEASTMGDLGSDDMGHVRASIELAGGGQIVTTGVAVQTAPTRVAVVAAMARDFAVVAGAGLETASRTVGDVEVRSHFLAQDRAAGLRVLDVAAWSLGDFQRRFGPYPYADFDVAEAPLVGGAGGVEFAGMVTVASMFYRPAAPASGPLALVFGMLGGAGSGMDALVQTMLEFVTAHEVAHQWWHGIVGSDSRVHPFLDEGLAQYSAMLYLEDRYGAARAQRDGDSQVGMNYQLMRLLGQPDAPVDRPVAAFGAQLAYAGLVYGKGPYVYREYRRAMGDGPFFDALRGYVARYRLRVAPRNGLVDALAANPHGARVRAIATRWLEQAHGDDDLGHADLGALLTQLVGPQAAGMGPELQQALGLIGSLGLLGGGGDGGVAMPGLGGSAPSPQDLQQMMRGMQQLMNEGGE